MEDIASGEAQSRPQEVYLADSVGELWTLRGASTGPTNP